VRRIGDASVASDKAQVRKSKNRVGAQMSSVAKVKAAR